MPSSALRISRCIRILYPKPQLPEKIEDSSDHLLSLLNDILDLSRIESGKVVFSPVPADITAVTDSAIEIINGTLLNRSLNFEVHREPMENPFMS